ncbi:host attachment protein [Pseudomonadota bacterium]
MKAWVVVASGSSARFFEAKSSAGVIMEFYTLVNPKARLHQRELVEDRPGRRFGDSPVRKFGRSGQSRQGMELKGAAKRQANIHFAKEVARYLQSAKNAGYFEKLIVISAPSFLGLLRSNLSFPISKNVVSYTQKDLTKKTPREIRELLPTYL